MSENNPIRVFVTHNFTETGDYLRVFEFLESVDRFYYLNVSKPEKLPDSAGPKAARDELIVQIRECEAVIVLASLYIEERDLVSYQMDVAEAGQKPLIGIRPFGGVMETPADLVGRLQKQINWNAREIVDAITLLARLEDTKRFEVIDFP